MSGDLKQAGVRVLLASLFGGVLYVFGSLALLVFTAHMYCAMRVPFLIYGVLGFLLTALVLRSGWHQGGQARAVFLLPAVFFLLGTLIPLWRFVDAVRVCAAQAGR